MKAIPLPFTRRPDDAEYYRGGPLVVGDIARHRGVKIWARVTEVRASTGGSWEYVLVDPKEVKHFWGGHHLDYVIRA